MCQASRLVSLLMVSALLAGCGGSDDPDAGWTPPRQIEPGQLFTVRMNDDYYRVVKVLAVDGTHVHLRLYTLRNRQRPAKVDLADLTIGDLVDMPDQGTRLGEPHLPVLRTQFLSFKPVRVFFDPIRQSELEESHRAGFDPVREAELDKYHHWQRSNQTPRQP